MLERQPNSEATPPWLGNRAQRRHPKDPKPLKRSIFVGDYNKIDGLIADTSNEWNQANEEYGRDITPIVYHSKPKIMRWLEVRRQVPFFLEKAQMANLEGDFVTPDQINRFDIQDYYSRELGGINLFGTPLIQGTSFFDIEQMPLVQSEDGQPRLLLEDIKRINGMFHDRPFSKDIGQAIIRPAMLYLVSERLAQPGVKTKVPATLQPLHNRLTAYFDYYKDLITNPGLGFWEERNLLSELQWGGPFLPQALGVYLPARLGITPSSAIKLYQTRAELSWGPIVWKGRILPSMEYAAKDAFRKNGLPKELESYQFYNSQMDEQASKILMEWSGRYELDDKRSEDEYTKQQELIDKLTGLYFRPLQQDVQNNPRKFLEFPMPEGHVIKRVSLASQYRQTLTFILHFADEKTHLTLELDKDQGVFGLPAKLVKNNPHIIDLILDDILPPVLEVAKARHPEVEPVSLSDYRQKKLSEVVKEQERVYIPAVEELSLPAREKFKHSRSRVLGPIARILEGPTPATVIPIEPPKFVVFHSREEIKKMMPRNTQDKIIEQLMREIRGFEIGRSGFANKIPEAGEDVWELRSKKYRILLQHIDGKFYSLYRVGPHGDSHRIFMAR